MPFYRCFANGEGFPGALLGEEGTTGFYVTCWVQASTRRSAELKAMAMLRREKILRGDGTAVPGARVSFDEVERVAQLPRRRRNGFAFYLEGPEPKATAGERVRDRLRAFRAR